MKAQAVYERVTQTIVEQLERGARGEDWTVPWHGIDAGLPRNASTGKAYRGGNIVALWVAEFAHSYSSSWWATYKQWEALGAQVRKGERATYCVKWVEPKDKAEAKPKPGEQRARGRLFPVGFAVFNASQVDGWEPPEGETFDHSPVERAEHLFAAVGADVRHTSKGEAFYNRADDYISLPHLRHFPEVERYYATLAHEHVHWTGAPSRLDREKGVAFGDTRYAREELVAELGSAFVCAALGIESEPREDHAQYLASWAAALRQDDAALFQAAQQAQKAVDYLTAFVVEDEDTSEVAA